MSTNQLHVSRRGWLVAAAALSFGLVAPSASADGPAPAIPVAPAAPVAASAAPAQAPIIAPVIPQGIVWEKVREADGIQVHRREIPGSPLIAFRGEGIIDAPIGKVGSVLVDVSRSTEWIDSLKEARQLRKVSESEYILWNHIGTPIVMKDRDFVTSTKLEIDTTTHRLIIRIKSVNDASAPVTDFIRGEIYNSAFELTSIDGGKRTKLVTEIHADPKGSVANWIVNSFQKNWPYNTIKSLRVQVAKPDVKDYAPLVTAMTNMGFFKG